EIARAISLRSRVVIMDEPTSSLTQRETDRLFDVIRDLRRDGVGIIYISHRLNEVEVIADRVAVLRDGRNAGNLDRGQISHETMVRLMVGRELKQFFHREFKNGTESTSAPVILEGRGLRWLPKQTSGAHFLFRSGEIVGL